MSASSVARPANDGKPNPVVGSRSVRFDNVLVGVDGSDSGRDAIALADRIIGSDGQLMLAHVVVSQSPGYRNFLATPAWEAARTMLERERQAMVVDAELTGMFAPSVGKGLHQLGEDLAADLLVVGSCGRSPLGRVFVGDDARETVNGARCPVAVAPHGYVERASEIKTIGVAYDGSPEADAALALARSCAASSGAEIRAHTVVVPLPAGVGHWADPEAISTLTRGAHDRLAALEGVTGTVAVGDAGNELVAFGDEVDLLIAGSRGHGPVRRLILGSTSLQLTREARCPLIVIPRPTAGERAAIPRYQG